ncbi:hypothetical protein [Microcoleus sp. B3-D2]
MIAKDRVIQKNDSQKLADISLNKDKSNQLWSELSETSEAAVSGGSTPYYYAGKNLWYEPAFTSTPPRKD